MRFSMFSNDTTLKQLRETRINVWWFDMQPATWSRMSPKQKNKKNKAGQEIQQVDHYKVSGVTIKKAQPRLFFLNSFWHGNISGQD